MYNIHVLFKRSGEKIIAKSPPSQSPTHACLHCGYVSWWFITGDKTRRQIISGRKAEGVKCLWDKSWCTKHILSDDKREEPCKTTAQSLTSASNHKPAEVRLASSLTASKANKQKTKTQQADALSPRHVLSQHDH